MEVQLFFALQISSFFATKVLFTLNCTKPLFLLNKHYGWNFQILSKTCYASFHTSETWPKMPIKLFSGSEMATTSICERLYLLYHYWGKIIWWQGTSLHRLHSQNGPVDCSLFTSGQQTWQWLPQKSYLIEISWLFTIRKEKISHIFWTKHGNSGYSVKKAWDSLWM